MKISCPSCKKTMFDTSLRKCPACEKEFTDKEIRSRARATKLMYGTVISVAIILLLIFLIPKDDGTIQADIVQTVGRQTVFKYSDKYTKIKLGYGIVEASDTSIPTAKRMTIKIVFPSDSLPSERYLQEQLINAAFSAMFENKMDAVTVWAYSEGDNYSMGYTMASCVVAPYGELRRAGEKVGKKDLKATFNINASLKDRLGQSNISG